METSLPTPMTARVELLIYQRVYLVFWDPMLPMHEEYRPIVDISSTFMDDEHPFFLCFFEFPISYFVLLRTVDGDWYFTDDSKFQVPGMIPPCEPTSFFFWVWSWFGSLHWGFCRWLPLRASSQWWHGCDLRRQQLWTMRHFTSRAWEKLCVRSDLLLRRYHCARTRSNWGEVCHHSEMQQRVGWGKPGCQAPKTSPCHELSRSHCERI